MSKPWYLVNVAGMGQGEGDSLVAVMCWTDAAAQGGASVDPDSYAFFAPRVLPMPLAEPLASAINACR